MADTKAIANRINSIKDTRKITNAMYLISSTRLRRARKSLEDTRPFFHAMRREIGKIVLNTHVGDSRFFDSEEGTDAAEGTSGILVITADKGLAGTYNQNVIKETLALMERHPNHRLFVIGEFGRHYFSAHKIPYDTEFHFTDHHPTLYLARVVAGYIMDLFEHREITRIYSVYTHFKNALSSEVLVFRLLPFQTSHFTQIEGLTDQDAEYEYHPSPLEVMERSIPVYCIGVIYSMLVYSFCCEQNDRMMAMDAANQNADALAEELKVKYHHLRQNSITQEITEISASVRGH